MAADLPIRNCVGCGQSDTDPRHVIDIGGGNLVNWHMDCHSRSDQGCDSCQTAIDAAKGETGEKLRKALTS